jgi:hypothetical protein
LGFGLLLGAALGMRVTGLIFGAYVAAAIAMRLPRPLLANRREGAAFVARSLAALAPAVVLAYLVMIAAWPWAALAPLNPIRALIDFAEFHYNIHTVLAGHIYRMAEVPRWYVPLYFAIKLPLVMLAGTLLALLFTAAALRGENARPLHRETALLAVTALFPLACHVVGHGPAFTGIRHFLFVVPPFAVLAGIGLDATLTWCAARRRVLLAGASTAMTAGIVWNATVLIELHPDQYLFFNPLVGGLEGASRRYDTDYWVNIMPEAVDDLEAFLDRTDHDGRRAGHTYTVGVCGERLAFEHEADTRLQWVRNWQQADFFIAPTHMNCDRALEGKVIATIERLGVPIGVIKDRRALTRPGLAQNQ